MNVEDSLRYYDFLLGAVRFVRNFCEEHEVAIKIALPSLLAITILKKSPAYLNVVKVVEHSHHQAIKNTLHWYMYSTRNLIITKLEIQFAYTRIYLLLKPLKLSDRIATLKYPHPKAFYSSTWTSIVWYVEDWILQENYSSFTIIGISLLQERIY